MFRLLSQIVATFRFVVPSGACGAAVLTKWDVKQTVDGLSIFALLAQFRDVVIIHRREFAYQLLIVVNEAVGIVAYRVALIISPIAAIAASVVARPEAIFIQAVVYLFRIVPATFVAGKRDDVWLTLVTDVPIQKRCILLNLV